MISSLSIGPRTLLNDCNHSATAILWRSAIPLGTGRPRASSAPGPRSVSRIHDAVARGRTFFRARQTRGGFPLTLAKKGGSKIMRGHMRRGQVN